MYKIECKDCDASYVGQTSRMLKTWIKKYKNQINWNTQQHSVITEHRFNAWIWLGDSKDFGWRENFAKTSYIQNNSYKTAKNGLNLKNDTDLLDSAYSEILQRKIFSLSTTIISHDKHRLFIVFSHEIYVERTITPYHVSF